MDKISKNYNTDRNKQIYQEYLKSETSFNKLAQKHGLTPQRIASIVKDAGNKGFGLTLKTTDSKKLKDGLATQAEKIRETGNQKLAIQLYEQILSWSIKNDDISGVIDTYGQLRICYSNLGKAVKDDKEKINYFKKAESMLEEALQLHDKYPHILDEGRIAILNTHLASGILQTNYVMNLEDKKANLEHALELINSAIKDISGTQAHKAWPKRIKGEILYNLGMRKEALDTLLDAEKDLFLGYKEEMKDANGELRLSVWLTGVHISIAQMAYEMKRNLIAKHYALGVLNMPDPEGTFKEKKMQAKVILQKLEEEHVKQE